MRITLALILTGILAIATAMANQATDIRLRELVPGVWLHTSYYTYPNGMSFPSNGLLVSDDDELILIDTAWGELETVTLLEKIELEIQRPINRALVTHSHGDRLAGVEVLKSRGIPVFSHPLTQQYATEYGLPVPDHIFATLLERGTAFEWGKLQVFYPGPAHAMDNIMVWLPTEQILFGGCAVRASASSSIGNTSHADLASWQQVMMDLPDQIPAPKMVVPGHGAPGGMELIDHTYKLIKAADK